MGEARRCGDPVHGHQILQESEEGEEVGTRREEEEQAGQEGRRWPLSATPAPSLKFLSVRDPFFSHLCLIFFRLNHSLICFDTTPLAGTTHLTTVSYRLFYQLVSARASKFCAVPYDNIVWINKIFTFVQ